MFLSALHAFLSNITIFSGLCLPLSVSGGVDKKENMWLKLEASAPAKATALRWRITAGEWAIVQTFNHEGEREREWVKKSKRLQTSAKAQKTSEKTLLNHSVKH